jgi:uncharacterized protein
MNKVSEIHNMPMLWDGPIASETLLILAHGAGSPMDTPFMTYLAQHIADHKIRVLRFEFPYMALRRKTKTKRPPNPQQILLTSWRTIIDHYASSYKRLFVGGKSMGGRMASMVADDCMADGLICIGYPFYAAGKPEKTRIAHLQNLNTRTLFLQGERDQTGSKDIVKTYPLSSSIKVSWIADGNHDLKPRVKTGLSQADNLEKAFNEIVKFIRNK